MTVENRTVINNDDALSTFDLEMLMEVLDRMEENIRAVGVLFCEWSIGSDNELRNCDDAVDDGGDC